MDGEAKNRADAVMNGGYGALMGFELEGGVEAGKKFIDNLHCSITSPILVMRALWPFIRPARRQSIIGRRPTGIGRNPRYVRLSIGIEHVDDIIADIEQALKSV